MPFRARTRGAILFSRATLGERTLDPEIRTLNQEMALERARHMRTLQSYALHRAILQSLTHQAHRLVRQYTGTRTLRARARA